MFNIKREKTIEEIKKELGFGITDEIFEKMTYSEIRKIYRKIKKIEKMCNEVDDFVEEKKSEKISKNT